MKRFIVNIVVICSLAFLFEGLLIGIVWYVKRSASYKLPKEKTILIVGDSSCEVGINPEYFPDAENVASSGTATLFTYVKIRKFVEENPQIDKIIMSCQPYTFIAVTWQSTAFSVMIPTYISLIKKAEIANIWDNKYFYIGLLKTPFQSSGLMSKIICKKIQGGSTSYRDLRIGGFIPVNGSYITEVEKQILSFDQNKIVWLHQLYFDKIIQYLNDKGIELVLLNTPKYLNITGFNQYIEREYPDIRYLDYSACQWDRSFFRDADHLNVLGARKFTILLRNDILHE